MKKAISLILVIGVVVALFSLAACGDKTMDDVTSMLDEGSTILDDISEDLSENLSEALSDERTEESTEDTTVDTTEETTDITDEVRNGLMVE